MIVSGIGCLCFVYFDIPNPDFVAFVSTTSDDVATERTPGDTTNTKRMTIESFA